MALWFELSFWWKASLICLKQTYKKALKPTISSKIISVVKSNLFAQYSTLVHAGLLGLISGFTVDLQKLAALVSGKQ